MGFISGLMQVVVGSAAGVAAVVALPGNPFLIRQMLLPGAVVLPQLLSITALEIMVGSVVATGVADEVASKDG